MLELVGGACATTIFGLREKQLNNSKQKTIIERAAGNEAGAPGLASALAIAASTSLYFIVITI